MIIFTDLITEGEKEFIHTDGTSFWMLPIPQDVLPLTKIKGCFARLKMFDPEWQKEFLDPDQRLINLDLDTVITGNLDKQFDRTEPLCIMQGGNASNPCPYNGAMIMLRAGAHPEIWQDFTLERGLAIPCHDFPDDQGWIWHKVPGLPGWKCGPETGIYVFRKPGWPGFRRKRGPDDRLPDGARLVTFSGVRKPAGFENLKWVREHWR